MGWKLPQVSQGIAGRKLEDSGARQSALLQCQLAVRRVQEHALSAISQELGSFV